MVFSIHFAVDPGILAVFIKTGAWFFVIALACDHGGFEMMDAVISYLNSNGFEYKNFGTYSAESCDYPEYGVKAARCVANGECGMGILICGTGIGMSIAANKVPGVRAALCFDLFTAEMSRQHNNANVLTLGARVTDAELALEIIDVFLKTGFEGGGRHARRVQMLDDLDISRIAADKM